MLIQCCTYFSPVYTTGLFKRNNEAPAITWMKETRRFAEFVRGAMKYSATRYATLRVVAVQIPQNIVPWGPNRRQQSVLWCENTSFSCGGGGCKLCFATSNLARIMFLENWLNFCDITVLVLFFYFSRAVGSNFGRGECRLRQSKAAQGVEQLRFLVHAHDFFALSILDRHPASNRACNAIVARNL